MPSDSCTSWPDAQPGTRRELGGKACSRGPWPLAARAGVTLREALAWSVQPGPSDPCSGMAGTWPCPRPPSRGRCRPASDLGCSETRPCQPHRATSPHTGAFQTPCSVRPSRGWERRRTRCIRSARWCDAGRRPLSHEHDFLSVNGTKSSSEACCANERWRAAAFQWQAHPQVTWAGLQGGPRLRSGGALALSLALVRCGLGPWLRL